MSEHVRGDGYSGTGEIELERLLETVAQARDDARRLKLTLSAHLLDMVCLDLSTTQPAPALDRAPA